MATELPTADSPQQCLERGARILAALQRAAQAARLEAQVAELESALAEAEAGAAHRLQRWLQNFDATQEIAPSQKLATQVPIDGWAAYLPYARRRLEERSHASAESPPPAYDESFENPAYDESLENSVPQSSTHAIAIGKATPKAVVEPIENNSESFSDVMNESSREALDAVTDSTAATAPEQTFLESSFTEVLRRGEPSSGVERASSINKPMMSGMSLSLIGHALLLGALFVITYKLPEEAASLGSQVVSVTAVTENVELGEPFSMSEPVVMELPESASPDASEAQPSALSEMQASILESAIDGIAQQKQSASGALLASFTTSASSGGRGRASGTSGGGGGPAVSKVGGKFFGVGAGGNYFCYVVDSSGSMRGGAWESAKDELLRSLSTLSEGQRFTIVFFAKEFSAIPEPGGRDAALYGLYATPQNIDHARRWIDTIKLDRGGPPSDALAWAIERQPDAIYLLTDGVTKSDVCGFLRDKNRMEDFINGQQVRVPIHAIAYHSLDGQQLLRQLAEENKGQFHHVPAK